MMPRYDVNNFIADARRYMIWIYLYPEDARREMMV